MATLVAALRLDDDKRISMSYLSGQNRYNRYSQSSPPFAWRGLIFSAKKTD
jgi:hypothetical protein